MGFSAGAVGVVFASSLDLVAAAGPVFLSTTGAGRVGATAAGICVGSPSMTATVFGAQAVRAVRRSNRKRFMLNSEW
jgi:hypothetical protein